ncbi:MAG: class I SAM-dependent methyltransferase [Firmicutes bacterium]|nr:class I SAM-dependent methyltransferase [Bacillota bacterium]
MRRINRLKAVANMVIKGAKVADIGADHAQLSVYLIEQQISPRVIIGELGDGPFARSCQAIEACGLQNSIELRQGSGLQVLDSGEVSTVVLAGMGGDTMVEILADDWDKAASFLRFVFQPMSKAEVLRRRLASRGWIISEERLVAENGRVYLVMSIRPAHCPYHLTDLEFALGPKILKADNDIKKHYIQAGVQNYQQIEQQLRQSPLRRHQVEAQDYQDKIRRLEEIERGSQS